ncbi:MAG: SH3 domain-containing protein [Chloroflexi bacterium]|nr:SH3 domain-containing protein [Chloroflexota bacterium]
MHGDWESMITGARRLSTGAAVAAALWVAATVGGMAASPAQQLPTLPPGGIEAVSGELELNVRAGPGLDQPVIGTLPPGVAVTVVGGPVLADGWVWCEHQSAAGRGWSVCLGLEGAQYLSAGIPAPTTTRAVAAAPAGGAARPTQGPPPPPAMTPVRLPLPGTAAPGGSQR